MRTIRLYGILILTFTLLGSMCRAQSAAAKKNIVSLQILGLYSVNEAKALEQRIAQFPDVYQCKVNYELKKSDIAISSHCDINALMQSISDFGYAVSLYQKIPDQSSRSIHEYDDSGILITGHRH